MKATIAGRIYDEWLESGKITEQQQQAFADKLAREFRANYEDGDYEDDYEEDYEEDSELPEVDYQKMHMPEVWAAATAEWDAKSPEEKVAAKKEREDEIKLAWGESEDAVHDFRLLAAVVEAVLSIFLSKSGFIFFFSGVYTAFKIGSNLGTDE